MDIRSSTYAISALRILPTVPQHLSTVSIPHFTFHIPQFHILPTAYSITQNITNKKIEKSVCSMLFLKTFKDVKFTVDGNNKTDVQ